MQAPVFDRARPIWAADYDIPNMFLVTKTSLTLDRSLPLRFRIRVDSDFALYVNGALAAFGQHPDYAAHKVYEECMLGNLVHPGENHLCLVLTSQNCDSSTDRREQASVIFELTDASGAVFWASGADTPLWKTTQYHDRDVPLITGQLGFSFDCDLCAPLLGETIPTVILDDTPAHYEPRPIAHPVLGERLPSSPVLQAAFADTDGQASLGERMQNAAYLPDGRSGDGVALIFDLGQEAVGFVDLELMLPHDTDVLIGWGEHLEDGRVRTSIGGRCFAARCRMRQGENSFLYPLRRLGLRYLSLHVYAKDVTVRYAGIRPVDYPLPPARPCPVEDEVHRAIYETCLRTLQHCMHDHYEDCPWREQALYTMDSRNQMLCGYAAFGELAMPRASLSLIAQSLREDGLLELCSPARVGITIPAFSAIFPVQVAEYLAQSGDLDFVRSLLPALLAIAEGFFDRIDESGLLTCYAEQQYWNFYEWQSGLEGSIGGVTAAEDMTYDAPLCCFVSLAFSAMAELFRALEDCTAAALWQARADALNLAVHTHFFDTEASCYYTYLRCRDGLLYHKAQLTSALAVVCGACPEDALSPVLKALATDPSLLPVTLSHSIFRYEALLQQPRNYRDFVFDEIRRIWGGMLHRGATTFWETAQGAADFGGAGSLCHGWSAVPAYIYHKYA